MAWFRVNLTEEEQQIVTVERESHPESHVRRKMLVVWSLHCGLKRSQAAKIAGVGLATVGRYVAAYREGGCGVGTLAHNYARSCEIKSLRSD